jgi:hypothetical protein
MSAERLQHTLAAIDAANGADPNHEHTAEGARPAALLYGQRMSAWLARLRPGAPDTLRIACRAQHIRRWEIPRDTYPMDRKGYHQWRRRLYGFHADAAAEIMGVQGYEEAAMERVRFLIRKERLKEDADTQTLEDAACLVFLEHHFTPFARENAPEKVVHILQRTWGKMSPQARELALQLPLPEDARQLVARALAAPGEAT